MMGDVDIHSEENFAAWKAALRGVVRSAELRAILPDAAITVEGSKFPPVDANSSRLAQVNGIPEGATLISLRMLSWTTIFKNFDSLKVKRAIVASILGCLWVLPR
jgi:hypothetical protein